MTEITRTETTEVVTQLEFHQQMAIRHTDEADRHMVVSLEEYIAAGEHLIEVKARLPGEFNHWVESEYRRSMSQAKRYMQVARNKHILLDRPDTSGLSLDAALRELAGPKEEKQGKNEQEEEIVELPTFDLLQITTPSGAIITATTAEELQQSLVEQLEKEEADRQVKELPPGDPPKIKIGKKELTPQEVREAFKALQDEKKELKEAKKGAETAEKNLQASIDARIEDANQAFEREIVAIKAKYGDSDATFEFMDIPEAAFLEAFKEAESVRLGEAAKIIQDLYLKFPGRMIEYLPGEAAQGALQMSQSKTVIEALRFVGDWVIRVADEMADESSLAVARHNERNGN